MGFSSLHITESLEKEYGGTLVLSSKLAAFFSLLASSESICERTGGASTVSKTQRAGDTATARSARENTIQLAKRTDGKTKTKGGV